MYLMRDNLIWQTETKICFKFNIISQALYRMNSRVQTLILCFLEKSAQMEMAAVRDYGPGLVDNSRLLHLYI